MSYRTKTGKVLGKLRFVAGTMTIGSAVLTHLECDRETDERIDRRTDMRSDDG